MPDTTSAPPPQPGPTTRRCVCRRTATQARRDGLVDFADELLGAHFAGTGHVYPGGDEPDGDGD